LLDAGENFFLQQPVDRLFVWALGYLVEILRALPVILTRVMMISSQTKKETFEQ